jgi:hypothetical protein
MPTRPPAPSGPLDRNQGDHLGNVMRPAAGRTVLGSTDGERQAVNAGRKWPDRLEIQAGTGGPLLPGRIADLFLDDFGILPARPQLVADLGCDAAIRLVGLDVFDHLEFALAVSDEQLAGFVRRRMAITGGLDHRAALFSFLP